MPLPTLGIAYMTREVVKREEIETVRTKATLSWVLLILINIMGLAVIFGLVIEYLQEKRAFEYYPDQTVKIIFDTDMITDIDDMGALAVLHSYIQEGKAVLLAAVGSCNTGYAAPCIDAVNTYYGLPDVPVGISPDCPDSGKPKYQKYIAENYANDIHSDKNARSALSVYRETLANSQDNSVVIIITGPLNNFHDLLCSGRDEYSKFKGIELVKRKVKLCVIMGGQFPESDLLGEYNIRLAPQAADFVSSNCPVSIMWCGFEVGENVLTGDRVIEMREDNPVRIAYDLYDEDRTGDFKYSSWDLIAVMYAVEGATDYWDEIKGTVEFGKKPDDGNEEVGEGYNKWKYNRKSKDAILNARKSNDTIARYLNERMVLSDNDM